MACHFSPILQSFFCFARLHPRLNGLTNGQLTRNIFYSNRIVFFLTGFHKLLSPRINFLAQAENNSMNSDATVRHVYIAKLFTTEAFASPQLSTHPTISASKILRIVTNFPG